MEYIRTQLAISERRACRILGQSRSGLHYELQREPLDEKKIFATLQKFRGEHPRAGYRRFWTELQREGISISLKVTYRIWSDYHRWGPR